MSSGLADSQPVERGVPNFSLWCQGKGWGYSLARTLHHGTLDTTPYEGEGVVLQLWWGPVVKVSRGDLLHYFRSPYGIAVERVSREPPAAAATAEGPPAQHPRFTITNVVGPHGGEGGP